MRLEDRAAIHAALAEPTRLAVVDALVLSDASPGELAAALGLSSNLLAHHLKVLQDAGLVRRARSQADRRRTYVQLVPAALGGLNPTASTPTRTAARVIFVCTTNSARSQLAAALWNQNGGIPAASAGTDPSPHVHHQTINTAQRHGLPLNPTQTTHIRDALRPDDLIVAVCDNAYETLQPQSILHWSVPDPIPTGTHEAFETTFTEITARINRLAQAVGNNPDPKSLKN